MEGMGSMTIDDRYRWHDIKYAPYDIPRRTGRYLVLTNNGVYAVAKYWGGEAQKWSGQYRNCIKAWKEIEEMDD